MHHDNAHDNENDIMIITIYLYIYIYGFVCLCLFAYSCLLLPPSFFLFVFVLPIFLSSFRSFRNFSGSFFLSVLCSFFLGASVFVVCRSFSPSLYHRCSSLVRSTLLGHVVQESMCPERAIMKWRQEGVGGVGYAKIDE